MKDTVYYIEPINIFIIILTFERLVHNLELALLPATSPLSTASTYQSD